MEPVDLVMHATCAIADAYRGVSKVPESVLAIHGLSSAMNRRLLNNLCSFDDCHFLEVGTFYGATALSASYGNHGRFITIDNFQLFGGQDICEANLAAHREMAPVELIASTLWEVQLDRLPPIDVLFYDADHSTAGTQRAIEYLAPALADTCIVVVDDWNTFQVREGMRIARPARSWHPLAHWKLFTANLRSDVEVYYEADKWWWNGLFVGVYGAKYCGSLPPYDPRRCRYPRFDWGPDPEELAAFFQGDGYRNE
jgi:predicted O-methyltransferase YrrM